MCPAVFLATDHDPPQVPWSEQRPAFNAGLLERFEESVRGKVSLPIVYSLGAHTSCACGFVADGAVAPEEVLESRQRLAEYVAAVLERGPVELYVCWNGEVTEGFAQRLVLTPRELFEREDWLDEGTHVQVVASAA